MASSFRLHLKYIGDFLSQCELRFVRYIDPHGIEGINQINPEQLLVRALAGMATSVTINDPATKATEAASGATGGFKPTPQETFEVDSKRDAVLSAPPVPDEKEKMAPGGDQPTHVPETKPQPVGRRRIVSVFGHAARLAPLRLRLTLPPRLSPPPPCRG